MKRSNRSKENFIALKQKNSNDEINNFFMHSYSSKTGNYLGDKRSQRNWKNWRTSRVPPSTQLKDEHWSWIRILFWNLLARCKNWKMRLILWMIQDICKMLNQYAVDIPTLPVNLCLSHLVQRVNTVFFSFPKRTKLWGLSEDQNYKRLRAEDAMAKLYLVLKTLVTW